MNWTAEDETTAKLVGILMFVAKILEGVKLDMKLPVDETLEIAARKAEAFEDLMAVADTSFPGDREMELRVLGFAKRMGFEVEQIVMTQGSQRTQ